MKIKQHVMKVMFIITVLVLAFSLSAAAPLQVEPPTDGTTSPGTDTSAAESIFIVQVIAIAAFFQKRLNLSGYPMIFAALAVAAVLWFSPLLAEAYPASAKLIESTLTFLKLSFSALGTVDFVTAAGTRIAVATQLKLASMAVTSG